MPGMKNYIRIILVSTFLLHACIDPFPIEQNGFEDVLVVEATLTDEEKVQQIRLSRPFPFRKQNPGFTFLPRPSLFYRIRNTAWK